MFVSMPLRRRQTDTVRPPKRRRRRKWAVLAALAVGLGAIRERALQANERGGGDPTGG
jgi:hypothetical protein